MDTLNKGFKILLQPKHEYTKTISKKIWDTEKIHVGDLIATKINTYRRHWNIKNLLKAELVEEFNVIGFVKKIDENELILSSYDENGSIEWILYPYRDEIIILHKNPFISNK